MLCVFLLPLFSLYKTSRLEVGIGCSRNEWKIGLHSVTEVKSAAADEREREECFTA